MKYFRYLFNYIISFGIDVVWFFLGKIGPRIHGPTFYWKSKLYPDYLNRGNMMMAVQAEALHHCTGKGLDIGADRWPLPGARPVREQLDEHAHKVNEDDGSQDYIFSSHTLEHLDDWEGALKEWHRVLKPSGKLFLYLPHENCLMWQPGVNLHHRWSPTAEHIATFIERDLNMEVIHQEDRADAFLSFAVIARKSTC